MASPANQHCACSIGTLSFPTGIISVLHKWPTVLRNRVLVTVDFGTGRRGYYPHSGPALLARSLAALRVALPLHCLYRHGAWAYNSTTESYGAANFVYSLPKTRRARKNSAAPVTAMMRRIFRPPPTVARRSGQLSEWHVTTATCLGKARYGKYDVFHKPGARFTKYLTICHTISVSL